MGRWLYRSWSAGLVSGVLVSGVSFEVRATVSRLVLLRGLVVPALVGRSYLVESIRAGGRELLPSPVSALGFSADLEPPPLMAEVPAGVEIVVRARRVSPAPVPFVAVLRGLERVGRCPAAPLREGHA